MNEWRRGHERSPVHVVHHQAAAQSHLVARRAWLAVVVGVALALSACTGGPVDDTDARSADTTVVPADGCVGPECGAPTPTCPEGVWSAEASACVQCLGDSDCQTGVCHPTRHQCVACYLDRQCPVGVCDPDRLLCVECLADADCKSLDCDEARHVCNGCGADSDCDDDNPCTKDTCAQRSCTSVAVADGAPCEADPCTEGDQCTAGVCLAGATPSAGCVECTTNDACAPSEFCRTSAVLGTCGGVGRCEPRPVSCDVGSPVCGCDGKDYLGECAASRVGVSVSGFGPCQCTQKALPCDLERAVDLNDDGCFDRCVCDQDSPCTEGFWCAAECGGTGLCEPPECGVDGLCDPGQIGCDASAPVCGCDGVTYASECAAHGAGRGVARKGACCESLVCGANATPDDTDGDGCVDLCRCTSGAECAAGEACDLAVCGGSGVCKPCVEAGPVCGCDGATYASSCEAPKGVASPGACCAPLPGPCSKPVDTNADGCPDRCACEKGADCAGVGGECLLSTCGAVAGLCGACDTMGPVCGCDGATYASGCAAAAAGIGVKHAGACECSSSLQCGTGQLCKTSGCGAGVGLCIPCAALNEPVCGCDGQTYTGGACELAKVGARFDHVGACCVSLDCTAGTTPLDTNGDGCVDLCAETPCDEGSACPTASYCARAEGVCSGAGLCKPLPTSCKSAPVCGCDGKTWPNACAAATANVGVAAQGACCVTFTCTPPAVPADSDGDGCVDTCKPTCPAITCIGTQAPIDTNGDGCVDSCPCKTASHCSAAETCFHEAGQCTAVGHCVTKPVVCTDPKLAVCGCDGLTYQNVCSALAAGTSVATSGACCTPVTCEVGSTAVDTNGDGCLDFCKPLVCKVDSECGSSQAYCKRAVGACSDLGTCALKPADCTTATLSPVCGCDGNTYESACIATAKGQSIALYGACKCKPLCGSGTSPVDSNGDGCADGCMPACSTACDCIKAAGGKPPLDCSTCTSCYAKWECTAGVCAPLCSPVAPLSCPVTACKDNSACATNAYCQKLTGQCDTLGVCVDRPTQCSPATANDGPVCGCGLKTYETACAAAQAGVTVAYTGACK